MIWLAEIRLLMTAQGQFERLLASRLNDQSQISYPTSDRTAAIDGSAPQADIQSRRAFWDPAFFPVSFLIAAGFW